MATHSHTSPRGLSLSSEEIYFLERRSVEGSLLTLLEAIRLYLAAGQDAPTWVAEFASKALLRLSSLSLVDRIQEMRRTGENIWAAAIHDVVEEIEERSPELHEQVEEVGSRLGPHRLRNPRSIHAKKKHSPQAVFEQHFAFATEVGTTRESRIKYAAKFIFDQRSVDHVTEEQISTIESIVKRVNFYNRHSPQFYFPSEGKVLTALGMQDVLEFLRNWMSGEYRSNKPAVCPSSEHLAQLAA